MWRISKQETRWFVAAGLLALVVVLPASAQTPLVEQALSKLRESPPVAAESFDFVVLGDSNTLEPLVQSDIFRQFLREFNILRPNLVIEVGDLVVGGAAEGVPAQWDLFDEVIKTCNIPYVAAPGNHDISDAATERIWIQRMGPTRYSFHYGNSFFVFLDSEEVGALERISDEQVAWLKGQLDLAQAKNIFVFLHQPYFEHEGDPDRAAEDWEEHWANVAAVFRGHPVRVVFAGHKHVYRDCGVREGVRYVISGGSASYGMNGREEEGSFHHYLLVRVRGEDVGWSVIKPGAVLPENVITSDRIGELERIRGKYVVCEELPAPYSEGFDRDVTISIGNPHDRAFDSTITWEVPAGWNVSPNEKAYSAAANSATRVTFRIKADSPETVRFPAPKFRTRYMNTKFGPPADVSREMPLTPTTTAVHAPGPVVADGDLREWAEAKPVPLTYASGFDPKNTADLQSQARFMWDESNFYLAVETVDDEHVQPYAGDIVWLADNVELSLDDWGWGLTLTKHGPEVFLYEGVGMSAEMVNTDVKLGVKREGTRTIYEAAFPTAMVKPLELKAGNSCRMAIGMNDLDSTGSRHSLALTPGGDSGPRVKVILVK